MRASRQTNDVPASVLMPVHNGNAYLGLAIESILRQTYTNFEFLIVDDGSTDGSPETIAYFAARDSRIRSSRCEHMGVAAALNHGLSFARGDIVVRMDSDDLAWPERIARQLTYLGDHGDVAALGSGMRYIDSDGKTGNVATYASNAIEVTQQILRGAHMLAHPTVAFRRDAVRALGNYRTAFSYAEDYDLWLRMAEHHLLANLPEVLLDYRLHTQNVSRRRRYDQHLAANIARLAARARFAGHSDPTLETDRLSVADLARFDLPQLEREQLLQDLIAAALISFDETNESRYLESAEESRSMLIAFASAGQRQTKRRASRLWQAGKRKRSAQAVAHEAAPVPPKLVPTRASLPNGGREIPTATPRRREATFTIGMATYDDYDGVYFTIQALRLYHADFLADTEFVVIDNHPDGPCAKALKQLEDSIPNYRYVPFQSSVGTAVRNAVFEEASGEHVLCIDCHVLLVPGALGRLRNYIADHPHSRDLLQGPRVDDTFEKIWSHMNPEWHNGLFGTWGHDDRAANLDGEPFDIPMQGLGLFACRRDAWLGFNPRFRGFGGEEGYVHEKFRRAGGRVLCLPGLRWLHRFERPLGVPYPNRWEDRVHNYTIGFRELGWPLAAMQSHYSALLGEHNAGPVFRSVEIELDGDAPEPAAIDMARATQLHREGRLDEAEDIYRELARAKPGDPSISAGLGELLLTTKRYPEAIACLEISARAPNATAEALNNLGYAHFLNGTYEFGLEPLLAANERQPGNWQILANLGRTYTKMNNPLEAVFYLEAARKLRPDIGELRLLLGLAHSALGDFERARPLFQHCLNDPDCYAAALGNLVLYSKQTADDNFLPQIEAGLKKVAEPVALQELNYAAAKTHFDLGQAKPAFRHLKAAKVQFPRSFSRARFTKLIQQTKELANYVQESIPTDGSSAPVFVVGMPDSGSTLIEQILSGQPSLSGGGERRYIPNIARRLGFGDGDAGSYAATINELPPGALAAIANGYRSLMTAAGANGSRTIDSYPHNFLQIALIKLLFPDAQIIHCKRQPLDCCLSIYRSPSREGHEYADDLADLGWYYRQYESLMQFWVTRFPASILAVDYENTVTDSEGSARRIIDFLGLPSDPAVFNFTENERGFSTALKWQDCRNSIDRWKLYEKQLQPLIAALEGRQP